MNLMDRDCLDQMIVYNELRIKLKHNVKIDSIPDTILNTMGGIIMDIPRYIGNYSCFYPIDIRSLSSYTISVLIYNENKYGRKMTISERISLDIKILIVEVHERYFPNSLKSAISDYLSYSDHSLSLRDFLTLIQWDPLNYDPPIPIGRGMTQTIMFEPWI